MFTTIKKFSLSLVRHTSLVTLIATTAISPVAHTLEIKLGSAMHVRVVDGDNLDSVGILAVGSVVEIPDKFKVLNSNGTVNPEASFNNWLIQAGYGKKDVSRPITDQRKDFYYPVRIISMAKGSSGANLIGTTKFMALRVLARSSGRLYVKKNAPVYKAPRGSYPLDARGDVQDQSPARPQPQAQAPAASQPDAQDLSDDQDDQTPPAKPSGYQHTRTSTPPADDDQDQGTEASDSDAPCAACDKNSMDALAQAAQDVVPAATNAAVHGLPGLSSQFPQACSALGFINDDGTYGANGQKILKQLQKHPSTFTANMRSAKACPNFNSFTDDEKYHFWTYLMVAVFAGESDCRVGEGGHGPDGALAGIAQMPASQSRNHRDDVQYGWGDACEGDQFKLGNNIKCSVARLNEMADNGEGPYQKRNNYWATLRDEPHGTTKALISQYEPCGASEFGTRDSRGQGRGRSHHRKSRKHKHRTEA